MGREEGVVVGWVEKRRWGGMGREEGMGWEE